MAQQRVSPKDDFDLSPKINKRFRKPIFVEESVSAFEQWLLAVILELRHDVTLAVKDGSAQLNLAGDVARSFAGQAVLSFANEVIRTILDEKKACFVWLGRRSNSKLGIAVGSSSLYRAYRLCREASPPFSASSELFCDTAITTDRVPV